MKTLLFIFLFMGCIFASTAQVGINTTTPDASAILDITATDKGMLVPRMTEAQKLAIGTPATSLLIYQTDGTTPGFYYYNGTSWVSLTAIGVEKIDDLTDGKATTNSLFLGENVGATETTGIRKNTSIGIISLQSVTTGIENTALGYSALRQNTIGSDNTAIGINTLNTNQSGNENTAIGRNTLFANLSGGYNTAIGGSALYNNTTGGYNSAIGFQSLNHNTTGTNNSTLGSSSLINNTTGSDNVAIGKNALSYNTISNNTVAIGTNALLSSNSAGSFPKNTAIGSNSFRSTTTGTNNTGVGYNTGYYNTIGINNVAIGTEALLNNLNASNNVAVGSSALRSNTSGANNTGIGHTALYSNTTGKDNTALGLEALYFNTTGTSNTAMGKNALNDNTVGGNNTAVGKSSLASNTDGLNNTAMGNFSLSTNTQGDSNIALGYWALKNNNGNANAGIGTNALEQNTTGGSNTAIGSYSFMENTVGNNNVSVGDFSGRYVDGNNNVFIGRRAGANNYIANPSNNKSNNVMIGYEAGFDQLVDNRLFIENSSSSNPLIYGEFDNDILRINGELQVGDPSTTGYALPATDGTSGQVLTTDGAGTTSWQGATTSFELKDPKYPDGFSGMTPITMNNLSTTSYTVPAGKNVYITNVINNTGATTLSISGTVVLSGIHNIGNYESLTNPLIAGSGNSITASSNSLGISGFLVNANITPITITFTPSYTIPANKILVILNAKGSSNFSIDGITIYSGNGNSQTAAGLTSFHNPIFLDEGQVLAVSSGAINGYLIDK
ncbi:MAG: hypothetical protein KDC78_10730 [Aequorivita sp.]|nr:hypothetical protein [Aequorivita sp.]